MSSQRAVISNTRKRDAVAGHIPNVMPDTNVGFRAGSSDMGTTALGSDPVVNGIKSLAPYCALFSKLPRQAQPIQHRRMRVTRSHCVANAKQLKAARRVAGHGLGLAIN